MKNLLLVILFLSACNLKADRCDTLDKIYDNLTRSDFFYNADIKKYSDNIAKVVLCSDKDVVVKCMNACQTDDGYIKKLKLGYGLCRNLMNYCCSDTNPNGYNCIISKIIDVDKLKI